MIRIHFGHRRPQPSPAAAAAIGEDKQCRVYRNNQAGVGCLIKGGEQYSAVQGQLTGWLAVIR